MKQLLLDTQAREDRLRDAGFNVVTMWDCELAEQLKHSGPMRDFFAQCDVRRFLRLKPRQPLAGGRTENWKYKVVAEEGESIQYLDVTSLYPSQMFFQQFPTGEPQIIDEFTQEQVDTLPFRGFIKAAVLPPRGLKKPVLPYRSDTRLLFPLCATCCEQENKGRCLHSDKERMLVSSWTDIELKKAVSMGYSVAELHEVWNWKDDQWKSHIYSDYIRLFYKIKLRASDWPEHVNDDVKKEAYLNWHREKMGMTIEADEIVPNHALRFISKLILNSLWGKMAQRDNLTTKEILTVEEHFALLTNPSRKVLSWRGIGDKVFVAHRIANEERHSSQFAALHHAAFITSYGRLMLYSLMEQVGERVQYCDTDSLIFKCEKGETNPLEHLVTGFLGQLSSEVPVGKSIKSVVCTGPKSYAIEYSDGTKPVKSKGIHQNEDTRELDYEALESIINGEFSGNSISISLPQYTIARPQVGTIITRHFKKTFRFVNRKSIVEGTDYKTAVNRPYGYF